MSYVNNNNSMSASSNVGRYRSKGTPAPAGFLPDEYNTWGPNPYTLFGSHGRTHTPGRNVHVQRFHRTLRLILLLRIRPPPSSRPLSPWRIGSPIWHHPTGEANWRLG